MDGPHVMEVERLVAQASVTAQGPEISHGNVLFKMKARLLTNLFNSQRVQIKGYIDLGTLVQICST